jgi:hypothetical protein
MRSIKFILVGAIACLFLLTACGTGNSLFAATESSGPSSCKSWEVAISNAFMSAYTRSPSQSLPQTTPIAIEKGWEPFSFTDAMGGLIIRRCISDP